MAQWYILYQGQQVGPMEQKQLLAYGLNPNSQVWCEGMPQWAPAFTIPDLMTMISEQGNKAYDHNAYARGEVLPYAGAYDGSNYPASGKSKTTAGIFALLLGWLGIHYFYCGKVGGGFITILLVIVTCGLWELLTFVQGILILTMSQEEFDRKYVNSTSVFPLF